MEVTRLFDLLPHYDVYPPKDDVLAGKDNGEWIKYSAQDYRENANNISYGLLKLGIKKGDKIATISVNRPEWNFLDMGILQIGAVHVPIYPTISESDYKFILNHSEVKYVFVSGKELLRKIEHILPEVPNIKGLYTFKNIENVKHLSELIELGKNNIEPEKLKNISEEISPDDIATLIYTSGTTGKPKGVMLSHNNIISNFNAVAWIPPVDHSGKSISYLPLCHVYERMMNYLFQYLGISVYYAENLGKIVDNIREIKPDLLTTVPRLLEKIFDRINAKGLKLKGIKRELFFWAVKLGLEYEIKGKGLFYQFKLFIADRLIFKKWREALGGNFKVIVSGGAAIQPRLARIFTAAGIPIIEGYGLTETSPVIAVSHFGENGRKFGTVGPVLEGVEVKIAEDGEILCKGPNVMKGYYKEPELTNEAIDSEGWFHTGDIGHLEKEGQLKITGRKKEIFKTSFGKYISPQLIENKFKESPFIDSLVVLGENQKFAAALIVPDFVHLKSYCDVKGIEYKTNEEIINNPTIKARFQKEIDKFNRSFGNYEQIKKFELLTDEWSVESGELTANLKLKRRYIYKKYSEKIEQLFGN